MDRFSSNANSETGWEDHRRSADSVLGG